MYTYFKMYVNIYSNVLCKSAVIFTYAFYRENPLNQGVEILHLIAMNPGSAPVAQDQNTDLSDASVLNDKALKNKCSVSQNKKARGTCVQLYLC